MPSFPFTMNLPKLTFCVTLSIYTLSNKRSFSEPNTTSKLEDMIEAPGLEARELVAPIAEMFDKISPEKDGWDTESYSEAASSQLYKIAAALKAPNLDASALKGTIDDSFKSTVLIPDKSETKLLQKEGFEVNTWTTTETPASQNFQQVFNSIKGSFSSDSKRNITTKLYKITPSDGNRTLTNVLVELSGLSPDGYKQINTEWQCEWKAIEGNPVLSKIKLLSYQQIVSNQNNGKPLLVDNTQSVLGNNSSYQKQLLHSTNYWRSRLPQNLGLDIVANHGFLLADLNGDDLEDLYLCQQGGLPNLLYLRKADGSFTDASANSGVDWLDFSPSALALDLDKDGDRDLIVATQFELLLMKNSGDAKFTLEAKILLNAQTFSLSAADYDLDGDLDIFTCGYNPSSIDPETGALGSPTPFHDANNGGRNTFLENIGNFKFKDITESSGMNHNNTRFSFARYVIRNVSKLGRYQP